MISRLLEHKITGGPTTFIYERNLTIKEENSCGKPELRLFINGHYGDITPNESDTAETFGQRIKAKVAAIQPNLHRSRTSGI